VFPRSGLTPGEHELRTTGYGLRTNLHCVDDADYRGVDGTFLALESHARGAALYDENYFVDARADCVDSYNVTLLVIAVNVYQPSDQQLAPVKAVVLSGRYYCSDYPSKNHGW